MSNGLERGKEVESHNRKLHGLQEKWLLIKSPSTCHIGKSVAFYDIKKSISTSIIQTISFKPFNYIRF